MRLRVNCDKRRAARVRGGVAALALAVASAGCVASPTVPSEGRGVFVGRVTNGDAFIAIVNDGTRVTAYVCDGRPEQVASVGAWLNGASQSSGVTLSGDGVTLQATFGTTATGTVGIRDGTSNTFTATAVSGTSGLFRAEGTALSGQTYVAGWILLPTGEQRGNVQLSDPGGGPRIAPTITGAGTITDPLLGTVNIIAILIGLR